MTINAKGKTTTAYSLLYAGELMLLVVRVAFHIQVLSTLMKVLQSSL